MRRLTRVLPYSVFALVVAVAFSMGPSANPHMKWVGAFLGVCLVALMLCIIAMAPGSTMFTAWPEGLSTKNRCAAARLLVLVASILVGRTDVRFLPYLLSGINEDCALFERVKEETDMIPPSLPLATAGGVLPYRNSVPRIFAPHELTQFRHRYRKLLKAILAQIGPEEDVELSAEEHGGLLLLLQIPEEDVELTLCILTRLERWGDMQAVPVLKRLIREKHWYVGSEQVEAAARQCWERIETRLRQQRQNSSLLRPAKREDTDSPRSLLRPATDRTENSPEQLLRPGNSLPPDRRE